MRFGTLPLTEAEGAFLAHSLRTGSLTLKKGSVLKANDIAALRKEGITEVIAAKLEPSDVSEDDAAARIAAATAGPAIDARAPFTGRVNLFAGKAGLLQLDVQRIDQLNRVDEAITIATLPPFADVQAGQMVATVKIIPFAVDEWRLQQVLAAVDDGKDPLLSVRSYQSFAVHLIQTELPSVKPSMLNKTVGVTASRLNRLGGRLVAESRSPHEVAALASKIKAAQGDLLLIAGASAITDRQDVLPAAIEAAGGEILHFGMPVDPGNLLLLGRLGERPVLGLPGCARSPKLNGFDWVLQRLFAGLEVTSDDIMGMGVGGLLTEIESRPQPRNRPPDKERKGALKRTVAALVLAAGRSTRMGQENKLLVDIDGKPMVNHAIDAMLNSKVDHVVVVIGHEAEAVREVIGERAVTIAYNPAFAEGLSTSLAAGIDALPTNIDGVLVGLGDMPRLGPGDIDRLVAAFDPSEGQAICVPTVNGKRGNPVLFSNEFLDEIRGIEGDVGARHLIGAHHDRVFEVEMGNDAALIDVDTKEALRALSS